MARSAGLFPSSHILTDSGFSGGSISVFRATVSSPRRGWCVRPGLKTTRRHDGIDQHRRLSNCRRAVGARARSREVFRRRRHCRCRREPAQAPCTGRGAVGTGIPPAGRARDLRGVLSESLEAVAHADTAGRGRRGTAHRGAVAADPLLRRGRGSRSTCGLRETSSVRNVLYGKHSERRSLRPSQPRRARARQERRPADA